MKKVLLYTIVFWVNISFAQYTEWHVKPLTNGGTTNGDGTSNLPWDLQTAFNNPSSKIKPGDIVWLHNGDYKGHFICNLSGTVTNYIKISSYPGEWARLDGNIYPYVPPTQPVVDTLSIYYKNTVDDEINSYTDLAATATNRVLDVNGGFVQFQDFEVTCLGNINRLYVSGPLAIQIPALTPINCEPNNGFIELVGVYHANNLKNKFCNLVIRNIPGSGMNSWKYTTDSEIYGCLIYNNGYINRNKTLCSNSTYNIIGKGPGVYSQNADLNLKRKIKNNIFLNNYDSGFFVWSSESHPTFDYLRNYDISKNVFINNGGPQRDETANIIIKSNSISTNAFNHPYNITLDGNIFYLNSRGSDVSGIDLRNSAGVTMTNNSIFKGAAGVRFTNENKNLNFQNNFYFGKRMQTLIVSTTDYHTNNWIMDYNKYHIRSDSQDMFEIVIGNPLTQIRYTLPQFQSLYNDELNSIRTQNYDINTGNLRMGSSATPQKNFITQNEYESNKFYVTIFNPRSDFPANNIINVDFSSYSIPNGKNYQIRDAENYFGPIITGNIGDIAPNIVPFPMNLSTIEPPTGVFGIDFTTNVVHSFEDLSVFVIEFGCSTLPYDLTVQNITDPAGFKLYQAKNNITFGPNYITDTSSEIVANASKQIVITPNTHIKSNAKFHAKIVDTCPNITYVGEGAQARQSSGVNNEIKASNSDEVLIIYPNPNSGIFNIESLKEVKIKHVEVYNINNANQVFDQKYNSEKTVSVDISNQPEGLYTVKVLFDDDSSVTKTIIKK